MSDSPAFTNAGTSRARRLVYWALVAIWAGVIFWFSSKPGSQIPGRFSDQGHLGEYFIFGTLLYLALATDLAPSRSLSIAILAASVYGMSDEFHQHFVVLRTPDVVDWGVDTIGAAAGALLTRALSLGRRKRSTRKDSLTRRQ